MKTKQILRLLKKKGFEFHRPGKGSHEIWRHPNGKQITVSPRNFDKNARSRKNFFHQIQA